MDKLLAYINGLSKEQRLAFAAACGTSEAYLRKAVSRSQVLGTALCVAIERETCGRVTRKELRPADWQANWPELASFASTSTT